MTALTPQDLLDLWISGMRPQSAVAWDTETSGLYADSGARVSTVSVAWVDHDGEWLDFANDKKEMTWAIEEYAPGQYAPIVSAAWPFDQGRDGKVESHGQNALWADANNLSRDQWEALLNWLDHCDLTAHNAKFDLEKMRVGVRLWPEVGLDLQHRVVWDTQNVNHLLWPLERTSLKPTCERLFGSEVADDSRLVKAYLKKYRLPTGRWDLMPWDIIGSYADQDARLTKMLELRQRWEIDTQNAGSWLYFKEEDNATTDDNIARVYRFIDRRLEVMKLLYRMEWRGLPYDEVESREAVTLCEERAKELADRLPFLPTDNKAKAYFFAKGRTDRGVECLDMPPYGTTEKGAASLTAEILDRMVADQIPGAKDWAEYRKVTNAASMWYTAYADAMGTDGRLRTCFRQNGTTSSRFSVERVNLQAIPQDYRLSSHSILDGIPTPRQLIASAVTKMPGWALWELDLAQAELRVGAMFAKCTKMLSMIENGDDLHAYTTQNLFKIGPEHDKFFQMRQVGKRANFSCMFGVGGDTFKKMVSKETGIDLGDALADRVVRDWNYLFPEFEATIDHHSAVVVRRQLKQGYGWVDSTVGERRWFEQYEDAHKAFNQRVQTNLAQFGLDWMLQTDQYLRMCGLDTPMVAGNGRAGLLLTIHDSQVLLLPDNEEGEKMAETCAGFGKHLWAQRFAGVPGDVDKKKWSGK